MEGVAVPFWSPFSVGPHFLLVTSLTAVLKPLIKATRERKGLF